MDLRISKIAWKCCFLLWFLTFSFGQKWHSVNCYRKPYSKCYEINFIKMMTFSLKQALSVDVWTSYSTSSQYYFPLTDPRIWSPYAKPPRESVILAEVKAGKSSQKQAKYHDTQPELLFSFEMYSSGHGFETFASTKTALSLDVRTSYSRSC